MATDIRTTLQTLIRTDSRIPIADQLLQRLDQALVNEAYRAYGAAMESAQLLEVSLTLLLLGVYYERSDAEKLAECENLHGYLYKDSLGRLIARLKREIRIPSTIEKELAKALELRNVLAHQYFWKHFAEWLYPAGLRRRIRDLNRIRRKLQIIASTISQITDALCEKMKIDAQRTIEEVNVRLLPALIELGAYDPKPKKVKRKRKDQSNSK